MSLVRVQVLCEHQPMKHGAFPLSTHIIVCLVLESLVRLSYVLSLVV